MRPKRYLPQESKQSSHDCPTSKPALDTAIFLSGDEIKPGSEAGLQAHRAVTSIPSGPSITVETDRCEDVTDGAGRLAGRPIRGASTPPQGGCLSDARVAE